MPARKGDIENLLPADLARTHAILTQYQDSSLDFVDATLVAIAERLGATTILTLDRRDFLIVKPRSGHPFTLRP